MRPGELEIGAELQQMPPLLLAQGRRLSRLKRYLAPLGPLAAAIDGNAVVVAERADPRLGPAVAAPGWLAGAIEKR